MTDTPYRYGAVFGLVATLLFIASRHLADIHEAPLGESIQLLVMALSVTYLSFEMTYERVTADLPEEVPWLLLGALAASTAIGITQGWAA